MSDRCCVSAPRPACSCSPTRRCFRRACNSIARRSDRCSNDTRLLQSTGDVRGRPADRADVVAFLLDLGIPIEIEDRHKNRPLHTAAAHDALRVAALLIERGAEIDPVETNWDNTPLDFAVYHQKPRMIELLSRVSRDVWNLTFTGNLERLRVVLGEKPERARVVNENGGTLLMCLPDDEDRANEIARLLIDHGADPSIRNTEGRAAADLAERRGMVEVAEMLRSATSAHGRSGLQCDLSRIVHCRT